MLRCEPYLKLSCLILWHERTSLWNFITENKESHCQIPSFSSYMSKALKSSPLSLQENLNKLKIKDSSSPIRELRLQGKPSPRNLESHSQDSLTWERSHWDHKLLETFKWSFCWITAGWVWTLCRVRSSWGLQAYSDLHILGGFTSRNSTQLSQ